MIAISLLYFCCKSYVATIKHKEPTANTFNISNLYFSKSRKMCTWTVFQNQVTFCGISVMEIVIVSVSLCGGRYISDFITCILWYQQFDAQYGKYNSYQLALLVNKDKLFINVCTMYVAWQHCLFTCWVMWKVGKIFDGIKL